MLAEAHQAKCAVCGNRALQSVRIDIGSRTLLKDLCARHIRELTEGARPGRGPRLRLVDEQPSVRTT
jgi:hypothetical protein